MCFCLARATGVSHITLGAFAEPPFGRLPATAGVVGLRAGLSAVPRRMYAEPPFEAACGICGAFGSGVGFAAGGAGPQMLYLELVSHNLAGRPGAVVAEGPWSSV